MCVGRLVTLSLALGFQFAAGGGVLSIGVGAAVVGEVRSSSVSRREFRVLSWARRASSCEMMRRVAARVYLSVGAMCFCTWPQSGASHS